MLSRGLKCLSLLVALGLLAWVVGSSAFSQAVSEPGAQNEPKDVLVEVELSNSAPANAASNAAPAAPVATARVAGTPTSQESNADPTAPVATAGPGPTQSSHNASLSVSTAPAPSAGTNAPLTLHLQALPPGATPPPPATQPGAPTVPSSRPAINVLATPPGVPPMPPGGMPSAGTAWGVIQQSSPGVMTGMYHGGGGGMGGGYSAGGYGASPYGAMYVTALPGNDLDPEMRKLCDTDAQMERDTAAAVEEYRKATDDAKKAELKKNIEDLVQKHFDVRQQRRQREITRLQEQLKRVEALVEKRAASREMIIQRRVSQLLGEEDSLAF